MLHRRINPPADLHLDFGAIRTELEVPGAFTPEQLAAAEAAAADPRLPDHDATDLPLVTVDPPGSTDLDQAVAITDLGGAGWRVHYAIADVAAFVTAGDPVDVEARRRTQTYYSPDVRVGLHPPALGEGAASLLPDGPRPAALWTIDVAPDGTTGAVDLRRAMVRSRAQLTYARVQADLDAGRAPDALAPLPALGAALLADARRRDAIELGLPEQDVVPGPDGHWTVVLRADLPVEAWNAQVSLLTGRAAASIMVDAGIGLLRTLPSPDPDRFPRLRKVALGLGIDWPEGVHPGEVLAKLDTAQPRHAAFCDLAAELLRGAGYTALGVPPPESHQSEGERPEGERDGPLDLGHAGVGGHYAHVTAPLRRLVDRFATEVCLAVTAGQEVPEWVREALPLLPEAQQEGDRLAKALERAAVDATEAYVLSPRVGEVFPAAVVESEKDSGTVALEDPAVRGRCDTRKLPLGEAIHVRCTEADVSERLVRFERVS